MSITMVKGFDYPRRQFGPTSAPAGVAELLIDYVLPGGSFVVPNCCSNELGPAKSAGRGGGT